MAKICCGGFYLGEGLELDGRTLKATGGSGLPDPSTLTDGTAMVAVNGEWKMQEGYGYTGYPAFETITWDGNTEGRDTLTIDGEPFAYKVSDIILTAKMLNGASSTGSSGGTDGVEVHIGTSVLYAESYAEEGASIFSGAAGEYSDEGGTVVIPSDGTYFTNSDGHYIASLTASSIHKFDLALIPFISDTPSEDGAYVLACTITDGETVLFWRNA